MFFIMKKVLVYFDDVLYINPLNIRISRVGYFNRFLLKNITQSNKKIMMTNIIKLIMAAIGGNADYLYTHLYTLT